MSGCCSGNGQPTTSIVYHDGKPGKSAYEIAVENGFVGTEQEWLESLVGPPGVGEPGPEGDSAYQVWLNQGNTGTEADYLASLKGRKGDPGPGNVLSIGTVTTVTPDVPAAAKITGESPAQILNLTIPQGQQGPVGNDGLLQQLPLPSTKLPEISLSDVNSVISHAVTAVNFELGIKEYPVTGTSTTLRITTYPTKDGAYVYTNGPSDPDGLIRTQIWSVVGSLFTRIVEQSDTAKSTILQRSFISGTLSFNYDDSPNDIDACGLYSTSIYLKTTITLPEAPISDSNLAIIVRPDGLPCTENGTLVPYNMWADSVTVSGQNKPRVTIYLDCPTPPTHLINPATKVITKLQRTKGKTSGLSSIYPEAPDGETANEFHYIIQYFYTA